MFKCSGRRMRCDKGSDAWNNLRISHIHVFLKNLGQHVPRKINMEFAKVRRKIFFGEDGVLEQPSYIFIVISIYYIYSVYIYIYTCIFILYLSMHIQSIPFANVASIQFCFRDTSVPTFRQEWFNSIEVTYWGGGRDLTPQDASTKKYFTCKVGPY